KSFRGSDLKTVSHGPPAGLWHFPYLCERGTRISIPPQPMTDRSLAAYVVRTKETILINENLAQAAERYGSPGVAMPGTELEKALLIVPLIVGDEVRGLIHLADLERENAFSESDVRLLQTLANSMSVALESARLFDETQRLLKETEQRNAEMAVINSIQQGMAGSLNFQGIVDLVGDKLRDVFDMGDIGIRWLDAKSNVLDYLYEYE